MIIYFISFFRVYLVRQYSYVIINITCIQIFIIFLSSIFFKSRILFISFPVSMLFFFIFIFFFFLLHFNVSTFISKHVFFSFIFHSPPPLSRIVVVIIPFHFMPDFCYSLHETRKRIPCMSIHPPLSFLPSPYFVL